MTDAEPLSLRVLAGRIRGASAPLERGRTVEIGYEFENDIVLRDETARGVRLRVRSRADAAELELLEGEVELLGHTLQAPATAILPPYMPLLIGENAVAIGEDDSPRWQEAERILAAAQRRPGDPDPEEIDEDEEPRFGVLLTRWHGVIARSPFALPTLAVVAIGGALFISAGAAPDFMRPATRPDTVRRALDEAGFRTVKVARSEDGKVMLTGLVATEADRARIQKLVERRNFTAAVRVETGERMALTVEDVFRSNGLDAEARSIAPGVVRVQVEAAPEGEIESVRRLAEREVKGLKSLAVHRLEGTPGAGEDQAGQVVMGASGPGKRVTAVVDGPVDYVATEDGSRYFVGAVLPTGHRITDIEGQTVAVEKSGALSKLIF